MMAGGREVRDEFSKEGRGVGPYDVYSNNSINARTLWPCRDLVREVVVA